VLDSLVVIYIWSEIPLRASALLWSQFNRHLTQRLSEATTGVEAPGVDAVLCSSNCGTAKTCQHPVSHAIDVHSAVRSEAAAGMTKNRLLHSQNAPCLGCHYTRCGAWSISDAAPAPITTARKR
jgi:hypothetical protein